MNRKTFATVLVILSTLAAGALWAAFTFFSPKGSFVVEVSLDNAKQLRLPIYRNAITSLTVVGDNVVGGTSAREGLSPFIFTVSLSRRSLDQALDLAEVIPGQRAVQSGFGRGADGSLYAGTMPDKPDGGGHLIRVRIDGGKLRAEDLGIPVNGEGVFSITLDPKRGALYGISHPSGRFFVHDLGKGQTRVVEQAGPRRRGMGMGIAREYSLAPADLLSRALVTDKNGRVYGSNPGGSLFRYDPSTDKIEMLENNLPEVWGRAPLGRVDSWAVAPDGTLFGGNAGDGQLFKIEPASAKLTNLGKPIMMNRLKCLAFAADGKLYGVAGAAPGYAHLFSYDPDGRGFVDLGNPQFVMAVDGIAEGIDWRGYQFATMAASEDGHYIVMGEEEDLSQLFVFPVN